MAIPEAMLCDWCRSPVRLAGMVGSGVVPQGQFLAGEFLFVAYHCKRCWRFKQWSRDATGADRWAARQVLFGKGSAEFFRRGRPCRWPREWSRSDVLSLSEARQSVA